MAEFPALPLWTDAYLADTRHLSTVQHGAYLLMLMTAWRSTGCCLKNDDAYLARITGIDLRQWHRHRDTLLAFWQVNEDGFLVQKRLLDERRFASIKRDHQSAAGKASALKRFNRGSTSVEFRSNQNPTPTPTPTPISSSLPPPQHSAPPGAVKDDDEFEKLEKKIRAIPGLETHPVHVAPSIAPIWGMVQQGWNLETEIIPGIKTALAKARPGSVRSWRYFAEAIRDIRDSIASAPPADSTPHSEWLERMDWARRHRQWPYDEEVWGPMPTKPGCRVPADILTPEDGQGWTDDWKPGRQRYAE